MFDHDAFDAPAPDPVKEAIDIFVSRIDGATSLFAQINGWVVGGAVSRVDEPATAVGDRSPGSK